MIASCRTPTRFALHVALGLVAAILASPGITRAQVPIEVVHTFAGRTAPRFPGSFITAADGNLYGVTSEGGWFDHGTIYRMAPDGTFVVLHSFGPGEGFGFDATLIQATDGSIFGATACCFFTITPGGAFTVLQRFSISMPFRLVQGSDGNFYGISVGGGAFNRGSFFRITPNGTVTALASFGVNGIGNTDNSRAPHSLIRGTDGNFYGTTGCDGCGAPFGGTVFSMTPEGVRTTLVDSGFVPWALIQGTDGSLYGLTARGGQFGWGEIFRVASGATFLATVYSFTGGADGGSPYVFLQASDGNFYGATHIGGTSGRGTLFKVTPAGAAGILHSFVPGEAPETLVQANDGKLYGPVSEGGVFGFGSVISVGLDGTFAVSHTFTAGPEGAGAHGLIQAKDGNFYGTTEYGGPFGRGTVFRMTASGAVTTLHAFSGVDGKYPNGSLIGAADENFYGTTRTDGGSSSTSGGTVFRITRLGVLTVLHAFGGTDGYDPRAGLVQARDGNFYGTTARGGSVGRGTIFRLTPDGSLTTLHSFVGSDGGHPQAALIQGIDGKLYGTAPGDDGGTATIFSMTLDGTVFTVLHTLPAQADWEGGPLPFAALIQSADGNFYGTAPLGFDEGFGGAVFRMSPSGAVTVLHDFSGGADGSGLFASLIQAKDGNLYGVTSYGGVFEFGTVFQIRPGGTFTVLHSFTGGADGSSPRAALLQAADGYLYGTTSAGGPSRAGAVFRLTTNVLFAPAAFTVARAGGIGVKLTWSAASGATSYTLKRSISAGGETVLARRLTSTSYVDATVTEGQRYYYVVSAMNPFGESLNSYEVSITAGRAAPGDFDGDGNADITVFRPSDGIWYIRQSSNGTTAGVQWGSGSDVPVPGDYDGDGVIDIAVFRLSNGVWYIRYSATGTTAGVQWGNGGDKPVPGDYDGDGKTDIAVFRPSDGTWYLLYSSTGTSAGVAWGNSQDVPAPADYDGDGRTDVTVFRPSNGIWYTLNSGSGTVSGVQWGSGSDKPVPGDYDGDGKADIAVFRLSNGVWYLRYSATGSTAGVQWGNGADVPVPGDYDGDGRTDIAVFRPSNGVWYLRYSATGTTAGVQWGNGNDVPILRRP